jgi:hypothetical protein
MTKYRDITGQRFGRLTAEAQMPVITNTKTAWRCSCSCGGSKIVTLSQLQSGKCQSCGCMRRENAKRANEFYGTSHNMHARAVRRLERMSIPEPNSGCWIWLGCASKKGYGKCSFHGELTEAHRVSYIIHKGDPGDLHVLHECDNSFCINPDHLSAGTQQRNIRDMFRRGRARPRGTSADLRDPSY